MTVGKAIGLFTVLYGLGLLLAWLLRALAGGSVGTLLSLGVFAAAAAWTAVRWSARCPDQVIPRRERAPVWAAMAVVGALGQAALTAGYAADHGLGQGYALLFAMAFAALLQGVTAHLLLRHAHRLGLTGRRAA